MDPLDLAKWVCSIDGIEGVTISGGEPFEQSEALAKFLLTVKQNRPELSSFLFTGYEINFLQQSTNKSVQNILEIVDMLSSGPFVAELYELDLLWRGSSNQQLSYLSARYSPEDEEEWSLISPIEEVFMHNHGYEYTGFKGRDGPIFNHLKKLKLDI